MRDFINAILQFIGVETLTDQELAEHFAVDVDQDYSKNTYDAVKGLLEERDTVSDSVLKLQYYFMAAGTDIGDNVVIANSNILIGSCL